MNNDLVLYGYDASSYVFTVRILLAEKGLDYDSVPVDVLAGEPDSEAHRQRHPFGKVPVLEHGPVRVVETSAIMRYVNDAFDGPSFIPGNSVDRARMDMIIALYDAYGYGAMATVVGHHRFPAFVGYPGRAEREAAAARLHALLGEAMRLRADSAFVAGERPTLADFFLAPGCFYLSLVDEGSAICDVPGFDDWWQRVRQLEGYRAAVPNLDDWGEAEACRGECV